MKDNISKFAKKLNINHMGICNLEDRKQAIVFLFPYYTPVCPGNISKYAHGEDYHTVIKNYLKKICEYIFTLCGKDFSPFIYTDVSPYDDKHLAYMAGLGFYGKNTLLINHDLGSFFFIGYIITEGLNLKADSPLDATCLNCGKCIENCPGKAISDTDFSKELCASHISQKKGDLEEFEEKILLKSGFVWGCDICQNVCPHNENLKTTPIPEFSKNIKQNIDISEIEQLSEKAFKLEFSNKAFTWRGKKPLIRNIKLNSK